MQQYLQSIIKNVPAAGRRAAVHEDSSRGEEDDAVRHGRGADQEVRSSGLSGPQHQVTHTPVRLSERQRESECVCVCVC